MSLTFDNRFLPFWLTVFVAVLSAIGLATLPFTLWLAVPFAIATALALIGVHDLTQQRHSVLRNYPISAHFRFIFEAIRPELRQYFFEGDKDGTPFSRD